MLTAFWEYSRRQLHITTTDATGRVISTETRPIADKVEAIAYAKSLGARFTC